MYLHVSTAFLIILNTS